MSGRRLRSGKIVGKAQKEERKRKTSLREEEEITKEQSAMSDAILEELKSLLEATSHNKCKKLVMKAPLTPDLPKLKALFQRLTKLTT